MNLHDEDVARAELKKQVDIAVEIVKELSETDPSNLLSVLEKEAVKIAKQREEQEPEPFGYLPIYPINHDDSGLRQNIEASLREFTASPWFIKNAKKIKKLERNWLGEYKTRKPFNPYPKKEPILELLDNE